MKITEASLCYRFYRHAGWTRSLVASLLQTDNLETLPIHYVNARWFDNELDNKVKWARGWINDTEDEYLDCDYYAVYNGKCNWNDKFKEHEIIPFGRL